MARRRGRAASGRWGSKIQPSRKSAIHRQPNRFCNCQPIQCDDSWGELVSTRLGGGVAAGADRAAGRPQRPIDESVGNEGDALDRVFAALTEPMPGGVGRLAPRAGADAEVRRGGDTEDFRAAAAALDGLRRDDGHLETGATRKSSAIRIRGTPPETSGR